MTQRNRPKEILDKYISPFIPALATVLIVAGLGDFVYQVYNQGHKNGLFLDNSRFISDSFAITLAAGMIVDRYRNLLKPFEIIPGVKKYGFLKALLINATLITISIGVIGYSYDVLSGCTNGLDYFFTKRGIVESIAMLPAIPLAFWSFRRKPLKIE